MLGAYAPSLASDLLPLTSCFLPLASCLLPPHPRHAISPTFTFSASASALIVSGCGCRPPRSSAAIVDRASAVRIESSRCDSGYASRTALRLRGCRCSPSAISRRAALCAASPHLFNLTVSHLPFRPCSGLVAAPVSAPPLAPVWALVSDPIWPGIPPAPGPVLGPSRASLRPASLPFRLKPPLAASSSAPVTPPPYQPSPSPPTPSCHPHTKP